MGKILFIYLSKIFINNRIENKMKNNILAVIIIFFFAIGMKAQDYTDNRTFYFVDSDDYELTIEMKQYLDGLADFLKQNNEMVVRLVGHTESFSNARKEQYLSEARAQTVMIYLMNLGIPQARIFHGGEGANMPIYGFNQVAKNNRIEVAAYLPGSMPNWDTSVNHYKDGDEHHSHPHHIAVFGGLTTNLELKHTDPTFGIDYEFRLPMWNEIMGVGVFAEAVLAEHTEYIAGGLLFIHPIGGLKFFAGGGAIRLEHEVHSDPAIHKIKYDGFLSSDEASTEILYKPLIRGGIGYDFHIGLLSIGPLFAVDYFDKHFALVYGLSFGIGF